MFVANVRGHHLSTSHAIGSTDTALLEETIGAAFDRIVAGHADHEALVVPFQDIRLTYGELADRVDRLARGLIALGLAKGDRVGMWSPNNAEWVYIQFAAAKVGVILVNIPRTRPKSCDTRSRRAGAVPLSRRPTSSRATTRR
jgi:fatty-acyl-CoA synthase